MNTAMTGEKQVALVPIEEEQTGLSVFERLARDPNVDVDKLERLMQMHERVSARTAEQQFNAAMAQAQTEMKPIAADSDNPQTKSRYASYEALDTVLRPLYTKHGFGLSFDTGDCPREQWVRVQCYVTHAGGHARTYHADMPADGKGAKGGDVMTVTHAVGAAMSYGMRYLLKMIFNVAVGEDDRDGNTPKGELPPPPAGFLKWWEGLSDIAPEGVAKYHALWKEGTQEYRDYVKANLWDVHEARKVKAQIADKARKVSAA